MKRVAAAVLVGAATLAGCGDAPPPFVVPGPTAPSRIETAQPLVWDSRDELVDWVTNGVSRGPITVEGSGTAAFIRIMLDFESLLRGPDLSPPVAGIRGMRLRARLRHDRPRIAQWPQTEAVKMYFDVENPVQPHTQSSMHILVGPSEDWMDLVPDPALYCCMQPLTVRYAYVPFFPSFSSTLDIDRIELTK